MTHEHLAESSAVLTESPRAGSELNTLLGSLELGEVAPV